MIDSIIIYKQLRNRPLYNETKQKFLKRCKMNTIKHVSLSKKQIQQYEQINKFQSQSFENQRTTAKLYMQSYQEITILFDDYNQRIKFNINVNKFLLGNNFFNILSQNITKIKEYDKKNFYSEFDFFIQEVQRKLVKLGFTIDLNKWYIERLDLGYNILFDNAEKREHYMKIINKNAFSSSSSVSSYDTKSIYKSSKKFTIKVYDKSKEYIKNTPINERLTKILSLNVVRYEIELRRSFFIEKIRMRMFKFYYPKNYAKLLEYRRLLKSEKHSDLTKMMRQYENIFKEFSKQYNEVQIYDFLDTYNFDYGKYAVRQFHKYRRYSLVNVSQNELTKKQFLSLYPNLSFANFQRMLKTVRKEKNVNALRDYYGKTTFYKYRFALQNEINKRFKIDVETIKLKKILK